ncbi:hypothetical protein BB561_002760 [Smittium simulii]|uniref:J domain-containing protein n=1 Tax=Smittium simulii TaxID=133385 RepID=A0A2T9YPD2_9FUNG|nr:hypothetical protein BB561_002760 [Smittium simulii]
MSSTTRTKNSTAQDRELDLYFKQQVTQVSRHNEVERILNAPKLDPFSILLVPDDCDEKQIKNAYKKISILIHPDKATHPKARDAFEKLKAAQDELLNEKQRKWLQNMLNDARQLLKSESPTELASKDFEVAVRNKFRELLIELEWNRRKKARIAQEQQLAEAGKKEAEAKKLTEQKNLQKEWEDTRDSRVNSWRSFQNNASSKTKKRLKTKTSTNYTQDPDRPYIKRKL